MWRPATRGIGAVRLWRSFGLARLTRARIGAHGPAGWTAGDAGYVFEVAQEPPVRIFLRPVGSPLTLGLAGLAVASFIESGLELRWIATSQTPYVGIAVLTLPFVLPLTACVFAYLARDAALGTAAGVIATSWLALGVVQIVASPETTSGALGLMLIAASALLALTSIAVSTAKPLPGLLFLLAALRFALTGAYHLSSERGLQTASGIVGLILFVLALYAVFAFELEDLRNRPVLPTFRRSSGRTALLGPDGAAIEDVAHDAGVRGTA